MNPGTLGIVAARGFTRRRENNQETGQSRLVSSPLLFLTGSENHYHLQKEKNTQGS
jgi:hypothetical protein